MNRDFGRSFPAFVGALLIAAGCISVAPSTSPTPQPTLAPGATATAAPAATPQPVVTPVPGATVAPVTAAPVDTSQPTTEPPATSPPTEAPPSGDLPAGFIRPNQAADHVGETATVCGKVNAANWVFAEPGHPTWLNLGPAYPNQIFNAVIWGEQRREWPLNGKPDVVYLNQVICVTGLVKAYSSWTQIEDLSMADIQVIP